MTRRSRGSGKQAKARLRKAEMPKRGNAPNATRNRGASIAGQETVVARLTHERDEALEQQTATSEVLRVISSSPGELEPVFQAMLENATRIYDAKFGGIYRWSDDALHLVATHNTPPAFADPRRQSPFRPGLKTVAGRAVRNRRLVHVADYMAEEAYTERDPAAVAAVELAWCSDPSLRPNAERKRIDRPD